MGVQQLPIVTQKSTPVIGQPPNLPQMDSVVLGLQQLERQQVEQEKKRQASRVAQQAAMQDAEDDDTAPSSTNNSNTNDVLDPGPNESSIGRFINNTRVSQDDVLRDLSCPRLNEYAHESACCSVSRNDCHLEI